MEGLSMVKYLAQFLVLEKFTCINVDYSSDLIDAWNPAKAKVTTVHQSKYKFGKFVFIDSQTGHEFTVTKQENWDRF